eukprot:TRINITY_DN39638_c0_g1_i1.p1 TRINITY_DN39638_c0_g1~~TRINITY_DN39638_c0_g1_i1.p1  ORF type:complete len:243 (+),score=50.35 TRINITY_DN39638_c0_g1_i1:62-790(+)
MQSVRMVGLCCRRRSAPWKPAAGFASTIGTASSGPLALHGRGNVLCFGDSLTEGYCSRGREFKPYTSRLQEILKESAAADPDVRESPNVVNAGFSGERTAQMLDRLPLFLKPEAKIEVVIILGGTNDLGSGVEPKRIVKQLIQLHEMAHEAGAITGVLTIPEIRFGQPLTKMFEKERREVNELLRRFATERPDHTFFMDLGAAFPQDEAHDFCWEPDGVHFTAAGYKEIGNFLATARLQSKK